MDCRGISMRSFLIVAMLTAAGFFLAFSVSSDDDPGRLRGAAKRNHERRTERGILKEKDLKIPTRDGSYLLADVYRPIQEGEYPVIMRLGPYGKASLAGCICSERDEWLHEWIEDRYERGKMPKAIMPVENHETLNTSQWVPEGYIIIKVDSRGSCNTPGVFDVLSEQEAQDYYDAIEWAADQPWSNGNVGLFGVSYYAMNQWLVAGLQPPSLKAIVPWEGGADILRDTLTHGGIANEAFITMWWAMTSSNYCGEKEVHDWEPTLQTMKHNPFYIPELVEPASAQFDKIKVPFLSGMGQDLHVLHLRGNSEAFIHAASKHKKLRINHANHFNGFTKGENHRDIMRFYDYWLKGIENGVMDEPPVKMAIRTGANEEDFYWRYANEWPVENTNYYRYYLNASPSSWEGDGKRSDFMRLVETPPAAEREVTYSAEVKVPEPRTEPLKTRMLSMSHIGSLMLGGILGEKEGDPCWSYGVSFISEPLTEDIVIAGYSKLVMYVSSTSYDMDIYAYLRVMDENNEEVHYAIPSMHGIEVAVQVGHLKVSHRKEDPLQSTEYRPYHTHLEEDYQPLEAGEVVEVTVEFWPGTAHIKAGHRIRLDVQPWDGCGVSAMSRHLYNEKYHKGVDNSIYTGPIHGSYLQLPLIPLKETR
jgi:putative CocE/NonD family hydrolase